MQLPANKDSGRSGAPDQAPDVSHASRRRRLIRAGASGAAVLLAVKARTALGQTSCLSPSAVVSGNMSTQPTTTTCTLGATPTVWKLQTSLSQWAVVGAVAPTFNTPLLDSTGCNGGHDASSNPQQYMSDPGTFVDAILSGAPQNLTVWEVMAFPSQYPDGELMAALLAAWFNAEYYAPSYPIKRWHVEEMWLERGDYCPASLSCGPGAGMSEGDMLLYIRSTFDKDSSDIAVCTVNGNSANSTGAPSSGKPSKTR